MNRGVLSKPAYDDLTGRITDPPVLDAFRILIDQMGEMGSFGFRPNIRGRKKSLHFSCGDVSYFAFTANNHWLLWYFRRPGFRDGLFTWKGLAATFPALERSKRADPEKAEGVLRISGRAEAEGVLQFVGSLGL